MWVLFAPHIHTTGLYPHKCNLNYISVLSITEILFTYTFSNIFQTLLTSHFIAGSLSSATTASDAASNGCATVVAADHVEALGRPEKAGHRCVQVEKLYIRFLGEFMVALRAVYHTPGRSSESDKCILHSR
jgi:hypothetical protein